MDPQGVPGAIGGPSVAQERKKALQEGPQAAPRTPLGAHKDAPRATKAAQRAPKEGQRVFKSSSGRRQIEPVALLEARKASFAKSAPRPAPADAPDTSDPLNPSRISPKSSQVGSSDPSSDLLGRLWSLDGASGDLCERLGSTRAPPGSPPGSLGAHAPRSPPALSRKTLSLIRG